MPIISECWNISRYLQQLFVNNRLNNNIRCKNRKSSFFWYLKVFLYSLSYCYLFSVYGQYLLLCQLCSFVPLLYLFPIFCLSVLSYYYQLYASFVIKSVYVFVLLFLFPGPLSGFDICFFTLKNCNHFLWKQGMLWTV